MSVSRQIHLRPMAAIASLGALCACETLSAPAETEPAGSATVTIDEATGAGVFFPQATSVETPAIRFPPMEGVGKQQRGLFVDQLNLAATTQGRAIPIIVQAVGDGSETLVFLYLDAQGPMTPYLARGILARLTSITRFSPVISEMGLSGEIDVYNMAAVLGFKRIIVTDGRDFAHEANLAAN